MKIVESLSNPMAAPDVVHREREATDFAPLNVSAVPCSLEYAIARNH